MYAEHIGNDATKNIQCNIYKALKLTKCSTIKVPLATETLISLNIIGWLRCNYYHEYLTCEQEDFCETIHLVQEY